MSIKKLEIIVRPGKFEAVKNAAKAAGAHGLTVSQVEGHGLQNGMTNKAGGAAYKMEMVPKVRMEVVVDGAHLETLLKAIGEAAHTGEPGDGKIFISDVQDVVRLRTGERGSAAV